MDIDEFRAGKDPPMINMPNEMHMLCLTGPSTVPEPKAAPNTGELKLKREKPLKRAESSLEKSLGIKRKNI